MGATALAIALFGLSSAAWAGDYVFRWVDDKGVVHITDNLYEVPKPYYGMYKKLVDELEAQKKEGKAAPAEPKRLKPAVAPLPASRPTLADDIQKKRKYWKDLMAHWRSVLAEATEAYEESEEALAQATMNPILRQTPHVKAKEKKLERKKAEAFAKLQQARRMLLEELPARAKREGAPPKWLQ